MKDIIKLSRDQAEMVIELLLIELDSVQDELTLYPDDEFLKRAHTRADELYGAIHQQLCEDI